MNNSELTVEQLAKKAADIMWQNDSASQQLGIKLESVSPGAAIACLTVESRHVNGHGICHGGFIFTLADTAFAFACNSHNQRAVAQHNNITYIEGVQLGDILTAEAKEQSRRGRSGIYDVTVRNQQGTTVALFRGHSRTIKGVHFEQ